MEETPPKRGPGRPATGQTPKRYVRAGHIWDEATELAKGRGETMTDLVIRAIEREVARLKRQG
jgi:hypothetical protein